MDGQFLIWWVLVETETASHHGNWQWLILVFSGHGMKYCFCQSNSLTLNLKLGDKDKEPIIEMCSFRDKPFRCRGMKERCSVFTLPVESLWPRVPCALWRLQQSPHWIGVNWFWLWFYRCSPSLVPAKFSKHISLAFLELLWVILHHCDKFIFLFKYAKINLCS